MSVSDPVILLTSLDDAACAPIVAQLGVVQIVRDLPALTMAQGPILFAYATSVIVPPEILARYQGAAYNLHAASPEYPGRDPHHWAVYDRATRYGATLHLMTPKVDDGAIIDVAWFDVTAGATPRQLLMQADAAAHQILEHYGPKVRRHEILLPRAELRWSGIKHSRKDFLAMCQLTPDLTRAEFDRRIAAFDDPQHDNLTISLHGRVFRLRHAEAQ